MPHKSVATVILFSLLGSAALVVPRLLPDSETTAFSLTESIRSRLEDIVISNTPAAWRDRAASCRVIEHHGKLGVAGYQKHGLPRLLNDVDSLGAAWFYNFSVGLPDVESWELGGDARMRPEEGGFSLALQAGEQSWASQSTSVEGGIEYELFLVEGSRRGARGGVAVDFLGSDGAKLGGEWLVLEGQPGARKMTSLVAPPTATRARVAVWGETSGVVVDDLRLVGNGVDVLRNGDFDAVRTTVEKSAGAEFVPMVWGASAAAPEALASLASADVILGFNEPDYPTQAAMTVDEAIALWPWLMATEVRLGSPATTTSHTLGERSWLEGFMSRAETESLRVDFIAVHYYTKSRSVAAFRRFLMRVHAAYGRPIWVTEWALVDWSESRHNRFPAEETARFLRDGALMMDELDFVERHAWFGMYEGLDGKKNINTHLADTAGALTPVGEAFANLAHMRQLSDQCGHKASSSDRSAPGGTTAGAMAEPG